MLAMMNVDEIKIPTIYTHTPPRKEKIDNSMLYYMEHGTLKSNIVVTQKGLLIDGYCNYLVAVVCGMSSVRCEINTKRIDKRFGKKGRTINNRQHKRRILYNRQGGKCAVCGKQLQIDDCASVEDYLTFDHILPVSRGGSNGLMNLQGLCRRCNHEKQDYFKEDKVMKEITVQEIVNALQGKTIRVESADIYGVNFSFSKARIEYDESMGILTFGAGNYNMPDGIGSVGIRIDDIVEAITLEDDGSYTIEFNQYMADINIEISDK